mmetsp:Transcript_29319/g.87046  ORF Transcript_29319/g.87046 Transcript_29319/m.87046 type:complete len:257 (+) Transcript_29319:794-1564(+)
MNTAHQKTVAMDEDIASRRSRSCLKMVMTRIRRSTRVIFRMRKARMKDIPEPPPISSRRRIKFQASERLRKKSMIFQPMSLATKKNQRRTMIFKDTSKMYMHESTIEAICMCWGSCSRCRAVWFVTKMVLMQVSKMTRCAHRSKALLFTTRASGPVRMGSSRFTHHRQKVRFLDLLASTRSEKSGPYLRSAHRTCLMLFCLCTNVEVDLALVGVSTRSMCWHSGMREADVPGWLPQGPPTASATGTRSVPILLPWP